MATNKYDNQLPADTGYRYAIGYYTKLKNQFMEQASNSFLKQGTAEVKNWANDLITTTSNAIFINTAGENQPGDSAASVLNAIFKEFAEHQDIQAMIQSAKDKIVQQYGELDDKIIQNRHQIIADIMSQMDGEWTPIIKKTLTSVIDNPSRGTDSNTLHDMVNKANQLFRIALSATLQEKKVYILKGWPMRTMQGYLREQSELNALRKRFENTPVKITHGGSKKVNNVETLFDNIISFIDYSDKAFTGQVNGTSTQGLKDSELANSLLPKIQFYGEQVKSFNITLDKVTKKGALAGHRIAGNQKLLSELISSAENKNYITLKENLAFMAQYKNIIEALGPATLFYSSGAGRQWTYEFIRDFRNRNYYLLFAYGKGGITSTIELNMPLVKSYKTNQTIKNKAYRVRFS